MLAIEINQKQLSALRDAVGRSGKRMSIEIAAAINATAKKTKLDIGRTVRETINIKKKESEEPLKIVTKAGKDSLSSTVQLRKTRRLPLKSFGARQDKKGVSYKISKQGGRKRINGAFVWKARGLAFIRAGKSRLPIIHLKGVSAWGVFAKNDLTPAQLKASKTELAKQIDRRIKLNVLRAEGLVTK